ncbi:coagulation factor VII-like [Anguilla anguilla]|uniref:coagulation factor VII-like n=1 Tax=Anguilla anguilla TaxID=7936 RepID=UPI0015B3525C|nr:coagulation factor VII-like [Anguilla anguilla]
MLRALLLVTLAFSYVSASVFIRKDDAHVLLHRSRRANSGFLEEMKQGNLERECVEEICDYEEAREVFEDDAKTKQFWMTYNRRDPCLDNPCKNNGTCIYMDNSYQCQCPEGFEGKYCQEVFEDTLKCLYRNGGCEQFCNATGPRRRCACAEGYALGDNGKDCVPQVLYPCGKIPLLSVENQTAQATVRIVGGNQCPRGHCPWQVLLEHKGKSLCGGVIVRPDWVITAAHCVHNRDITDFKVVAGEHDLSVPEDSEQRISVAQAIAHERYDAASGDSDIALVRLREPVAFSTMAAPVCLPEREFSLRELSATRLSTLSGWGGLTAGGNAPPPGPARPVSPVLRRLEVPLVPAAECGPKSGVNLTQSMFCAGYLHGLQPACRGDDGSPLVTQYRGTAFLTGLVGWGRGCQTPGYYGIFTRVDHFLPWLHETMSTPKPRPQPDPQARPQTLPQPEVDLEQKQV